MFSSSSKSAIFVAVLFVLGFTGTLVAQSKPQKPTNVPGDQKKNNRPTPMTEEEKKKYEEEQKRKEEEKNSIIDPTIERVESNIVLVDAVVFHKKTGQIVTGLKKENFAIFENGIKQNISSFATPESPITVTLVVEFSKWTELFGGAGSGGGYWEPGTYEVIRPVAQFVSKFIKPPNDYASIVAFDMRPTPITDFTNDPNRLNQAVNILLRNQPAFRENNLFDALKFSLVGGRADSVVLERSKEQWSNYGGMVDVRSKRRAIILVASGIDTFSKVTYDEVRRVIQEAGVPIYIISTGNLFFKKYEQYIPVMDNTSFGGLPGRMTFLQATNTMNTFALESGGKHFPMTFESEVGGIVNDINAMLRNQYSMAYDLADGHAPGKKYKIEVKVDVDGDGEYDNKVYAIQHKPFYQTPKAEKKKD